MPSTILANMELCIGIFKMNAFKAVQSLKHACQYTIHRMFCQKCSASVFPLSCPCRQTQQLVTLAYQNTVDREHSLPQTL
eukprot:1161789-Pelagomonas_calceolata.AAC.2